MALRQLWSVKGKGLNSIPWRFALMAVVLTGAIAAVGFRALHGPSISWAWMVALVVLLPLPTLANFMAASKLAGMIRALGRSTQALATGSFDQPVDVDCACEVGGLADNFRAMVARLNGNILRMNTLAYTDTVTGLPNRAVINHILGLARREGAAECAGAMLFIDLDGFKRVNDTIGHRSGDELLRQVALRIIEQGLELRLDELDTCTSAMGDLCETCPTRPVFARYAGDEFTALLPGRRSRDALAAIAERILGVLSQPFVVHGNEVFIGASIGIACMPEDAQAPEQLLTYADIAMYRAKESGKNAYAFFDASLKGEVERRTLIERELHHAVLEGGLMLHFQPKVCARTGALAGVEALVRWDCPGLGMVPPDQFIAIAEQCGLMVPLGESILRMAVTQARQWADEGEPLRVAINVSPVQFERPGVVELVLQVIGEAGLDPTLIELEITESIAMADFTRTRARIGELRAHGIRISIDDFGIGYSNLSQLARLEFDAVKIDRSLVGSIGESPKAETMLAAIVGITHALGHKVIAEGIETHEQMAYLARLGCEEFQGYLLGRPMPAAQLREWIEARGTSPARDQITALARRIAG